MASASDAQALAADLPESAPFTSRLDIGASDVLDTLIIAGLQHYASGNRLRSRSARLGTDNSLPSGACHSCL